MDIEPQSKRYQLSVAYISLTLHEENAGIKEPESDELDRTDTRDKAALANDQTQRSQSRTGEAHSLEKQSNSRSSLVPAEFLLDQLHLRGGRLLIRGDAGSGKSTLFRWMALMAANSGTGIPSKGHVGPHAPRPHVEPVKQMDTRDIWYTHIPLLIRLRDCKNGRLPPISEFTQHTNRFLESPPAGWIQSVMEQGRALVLLDGVDEVPGIDRQSVYADLENLVGMYKSCYYVLSTRPAAVDKDWLKPLGFHEAFLNPLSVIDRDRLIERWHEAVAKEFERAGKPSTEIRTLTEGLKAQLLQNPPIARLATNPLLAAVICALHQKRQQELPKSQSELCEALCQMLLERREKESHLDASVSSAPYRNLTYSQRKQIVSELAHHMVLNERSTLEEQDAVAQLAKVLDTVPEHSGGDAHIVMKNLIERSGMLRDARPGAIDFIHNTFKEYLAAHLFARNGDYGLLAKNAIDPSWQHVLLFAASESSGQIGFAEKLITQVMDAADPQPIPGLKTMGYDRKEKKRQYQLMAIRLQASAQFLSKTLEARLESSRGELFPPKSMDEAGALASAGDVVVPFLKYSAKTHQYDAAACVRTLRLIASPKARAQLREYLEDLRPPVVEELAQAVNPLEIRAVQKLLLSGKSLSRGIRSQVSDLMPLSCLPSLQELDLSGTSVSDLTPLSSLSSLQELDLSKTRVSNLTPLASLSSLKKLDLRGTAVSDLTPLASLTQLQLLNIADTAVSDLRPLASLFSLQVLYLTGSSVSDLTPLASLPALRSRFGP